MIRPLDDTIIMIYIKSVVADLAAISKGDFSNPRFEELGSGVLPKTQNVSCFISRSVLLIFCPFAIRRSKSFESGNCDRIRSDGWVNWITPVPQLSLEPTYKNVVENSQFSARLLGVDAKCQQSTGARQLTVRPP